MKLRVHLSRLAAVLMVAGIAAAMLTTQPLTALAYCPPEDYDCNAPDNQPAKADLRVTVTVTHLGSEPWDGYFDGYHDGDEKYRVTITVRNGGTATAGSSVTALQRLYFFGEWASPFSRTYNEAPLAAGAARSHVLDVKTLRRQCLRVTVRVDAHHQVLEVTESNNVVEKTACPGW